ncbi:MAG TPA: hypothetical protein VN372_00670 [Methanospirillum sp.]|nr:hypothetical protein [Methanospirillum sp.]
MAQKCSVCSHKDRQRIDEAIVSGQSNRTMATQYGVSISAVQRHRAHIPAALAESKHAEEVTDADNLISDLQYLRGEAIAFLNKAKAADDLRAAAPLIGAALKTIETLAEVRGEIDRKTEINITLNPIWLETRTLILTSLLPYPEARRAVSIALQEGLCKEKL